MPRPDTPWTPATVARLREMWSAGAPRADIASAIGVTRQQLGDKIIALRLPAREVDRVAKAQPTAIPAAQIDVIRTMRLAGHTCAEVSGATGVSVNRVYSICRRLGLPLMSPAQAARHGWIVRAARAAHVIGAPP